MLTPFLRPCPSFSDGQEQQSLIVLVLYRSGKEAVVHDRTISDSFASDNVLCSKLIIIVNFNNG